MDPEGEAEESEAGVGIARIRAARRRTASAASSGASEMRLGSASSISWSTSSRGAYDSRARRSGRVPNNIRPHSPLPVSPSPPRRDRSGGSSDAETRMLLFPSSRG